MQLTIEQLKTLFAVGSRVDRRGKNLIAACPQCGQMEFGISLAEDHRFGCYRKAKCGFSGNIYSLLKYLGRTDFIVSTGKNILDKLSPLEEFAEQNELDLALPECKPPLGWRRIKDHPYLNERGFTEYERYKVGVSMLAPKLGKDYVVFLIEEGDEVKGYVSRNIRSKKEIEEANIKLKAQGKSLIKRYVNSETDFGKIAFGLNEIVKGVTKILIVVEGIFDKFNIDRLLELHLQDEVKCNGTFKCACSPEQVYKWLELGIETIILFYDPDVPKEIKKTAFELEKYFTVKIAFNAEGSDPGDITGEQLEVVLDNLQGPESFSIGQLNHKKLDI